MRTRSLFLTLPFLSMLLAACASTKPVQLPADEVLRRAVLHTALLESVDLDAIATIQTFSGPHPLGATLVLTGTLFPLRSAYSLTIGGTMKRTIAFVSDTILAPDPVRLTALSSAMTIESASLEQDLHGSFLYSLSVSLDPRAAGFTVACDDARIAGALTIDALTFRILHADWTLTNIPFPIGQGNAHLDLHFHNENRISVASLVLTGSTLQGESIFDMIFAS